MSKLFSLARATVRVFARRVLPLGVGSWFALAVSVAAYGKAPAGDFVVWQQEALAPLPRTTASVQPLAAFGQLLIVGLHDDRDALWCHRPESGWQRSPLPLGTQWSGGAAQDEGRLWLAVQQDRGEALWSLPVTAFSAGETLAPDEAVAVPPDAALTAMEVHANNLWVLARQPRGGQELMFASPPLLGQARQWVRHPGPAAGLSGRWILALQRYRERVTAFAWHDAADEGVAVQGWRWDATERQWHATATAAATDLSTASRIGVSHLLLLPSTTATRFAGFHVYSTNTDRWTELGASPGLGAGAARLVNTEENGLPRLLRVTGEGVATWAAALSSERRRLPMIDYALLGCYFLCVIGLGYRMSRRQKGADDFFRGGQRVPGWAAGFSLIASKISAVSFVSVPAKAFATNWVFLPFQLASMLIVPIAVRYFVPFIRRLNVTSVYEYLERRYHVSLRLVASGLSSCSAVLLLGVYIYVASLILSVLTGFPISFCIVAMGGLATLYTVMGGIEAVIWIDVIQTIVIMTGAIGAVVVAMYGSGLGPAELIGQAWGGGKMKLFVFDFSLTQATLAVWVLFMLAKPVEYLSSQTVVQRLISTPSLREAKRTSWISLLLGAPIVVLFYFLGTALYFFYRENPRHLPTTMTHPDQLFPSFIVLDLPTGVTGIVIGAIFMASLDIGLGNEATTLTRDFYTRLVKGANEQRTLRVARWVTLGLGTIGTGSALMLTAFPVQSLLDRLFTILAFFSGLMSGLFLLGVLSRRAHTRGVIVGLALTALAQVAIMKLTPLHFYTYAFTGLVLNLIFGYTASRLIPSAPASPEADHLQIWSLPEELDAQPVK